MMAMATVSKSKEEFSIWLKKKLVDLNTDDEIFSPYILGILGDDDSEEDKLEALEGILSEIIENGINDLCHEILKKWASTLENDSKEEEKTVEKINVDEKLAKLMEENKIQSVQVAPKVSTEAQKLKDAILAQYAEVSDGETEDEEVREMTSSNIGLMKNLNAECVAKAEREKRDKEKEEAQKKKEKDKEDRAKQKSKDEERKEKEKKRTQKGERRR